MAKAVKVQAPVDGFTGVVAGVNFTDGFGETDNPNALNYFRRHGYGVGGEPPVVPAEEAEEDTTVVEHDTADQGEVETPDEAAEKVAKPVAKKAAAAASKK